MQCTFSITGTYSREDIQNARPPVSYLGDYPFANCLGFRFFEPKALAFAVTYRQLFAFNHYPLWFGRLCVLCNHYSEGERVYRTVMDVPGILPKETTMTNNRLKPQDTLLEINRVGGTLYALWWDASLARYSVSKRTDGEKYETVIKRTRDWGEAKQCLLEGGTK